MKRASSNDLSSESGIVYARCVLMASFNVWRRAHADECWCDVMTTHREERKARMRVCAFVARKKAEKNITH